VYVIRMLLSKPHGRGTGHNPTKTRKIAVLRDGKENCGATWNRTKGRKTTWTIAVAELRRAIGVTDPHLTRGCASCKNCGHTERKVEGMQKRKKSRKSMPLTARMRKKTKKFYW